MLTQLCYPDDAGSSGANETDSTAQGTVPSAVASGVSLATAGGANPSVVQDALSVAGEGTAAEEHFGPPRLRPSLPRACKKSRTPQVQPTSQPEGKPKPPSECKLVTFFFFLYSNPDSSHTL